MKERAAALATWESLRCAHLSKVFNGNGTSDSLLMNRCAYRIRRFIDQTARKEGLETELYDARIALSSVPDAGLPAIEQALARTGVGRELDEAWERWRDQ